MSEPLKVGMIGCGVISGIYAHNIPRFRDIALVACADLRPEAADALAAKAGIRAMTVDALLADPDIDIVLNLTVPVVHAEVAHAALDAGKHVYSEKPLGITVTEGEKLVAAAEAKGLKIGVAPDTFLGAAHRNCRELVDSGEVGSIIAGTCFILSSGMESWHPNPAFFFQRGGGPVLDVGPYYITALINLLGPVTGVAAMDGKGFAERVVGADGPHKGERIKVEVPTTALGLMRFACGAHIFLGASWDVKAHGHRPMELYGSRASIRPPDPNFFGGDIEVAKAKDEWTAIDPSSRPFGEMNWPVDAPNRANHRGLGLAELAAAVKAGRPNRASGRLGLHMLQVAEAIGQSAAEGRFVAIDPAIDRPEAMTDSEAKALLR
ncbi:MAG: Gfo/Idh/MocA family oxidoreductase [Alphaproteobacteria bacterium]